MVRRLLAESVFKVEPGALRVVTHDVGGGFGMKVQPYAEYAAVLHAARRLGRPVKWCATRVESFLADTHGRDGVLEGELALDAAGRFLALRVRTRVGIGAYTSTFAAVFATNNTKNCLSSVYAIPAIQIDVQMVFTNAAPLGPYRGAGRPEAIYLIERLIDGAAAAMGIDRVELRRRNLIPPSAMPYRAPTAQIYDSGRVRGGPGPGAGPGRLAGLPGAAGGVGARGPAARHRRRAASWKWPAASSTRRWICASRRTGRWRSGPACRPWARGISPRSRPSSRGGSAWTRPRCGWSRETATRSRPARRAWPPGP